MSGLFSGWPGTTTAPPSPPLRSAAGESRRKFERCCFSPWQAKQRSASTGRTLLSKNSNGSGWFAAGLGVFSTADHPASAAAQHHAARKLQAKNRTRIKESLWGESNKVVGRAHSSPGVLRKLIRGTGGGPVAAFELWES